MCTQLNGVKPSGWEDQPERVCSQLRDAYCADVDPAKMKVQRCMVLQFRELVEPKRIPAAGSTAIFLYGVGARSRKASIGDN
jgi:hypothetical protein